MQSLETFAGLIMWALPLIVLGAIILSQMIRILREYERGVIFRLGKLLRAKGPGLILLIPIVDRIVKVDLRVVTINVPQQEMMTRDNVPVTVDAVVYFRVLDPEAAIIKVENFLKATSLIAQTTLRSVIGQAELDELLSQREKINQRLQEIIDRQTEPWGIKVTAVEVKDVMTFSRILDRSQLEFPTVRSSRFVVGFLCLSSLANAAGGKFANELCGRWTL